MEHMRVHCPECSPDDVGAMISGRKTILCKNNGEYGSIARPSFCPQVPHAAFYLVTNASLSLQRCYFSFCHNSFELLSSYKKIFGQSHAEPLQKARPSNYCARSYQSDLIFFSSERFTLPLSIRLGFIQPRACQCHWHAPLSGAWRSGQTRTPVSARRRPS